MSEYKGIKGFRVQTRETDPSDPIIGDFYYNSGEGKFKNIADGFLTGTFASGGTMNTARYRMMGGFGNSSSAVAVGGQSPAKANVESYNGTSWTETTDIPTANSDNGCTGTATAGINVGGVYDQPQNNQAYTWNGSAWTEVTDYPTGSARMCGAGTQTACIYKGGQGTPAAPGYRNECYTWNGSAWAEAGDYPQISSNGGIAGSTTAAIAAGGYGGSPQDGSNTYDGTSWTATTPLNAAKDEIGYSHQGTQTAAIFAAQGSTTVAEQWNGTSWSEGNDLNTGRGSVGSAGGLTNFIIFGGSSPALSPTTTGVTEEFSQSATNIKTVTSS
jgi:hypothetical protein|tara:strand:- start:26 stop:1012 length:987 start_codon:yes stop_codon:yes gene_type:complete